MQMLDLERMALASDCMQLGYDHLGEALNAEIQQQAGVSHEFTNANTRQKFDLECLRAADCMHLVGEGPGPGAAAALSQPGASTDGRSGNLPQACLFRGVAIT